jgi:single-strand DNA-binding protein
MARSLNKVMIIGNLTRDPEMKTTQSGQNVATLGVATNRQWKNQGGETQEQTEFHDVVVWGKLAEICQQYLSKGQKVYFEGRLQTRQWEAQDGSKRQRTEIVAEDMLMLDGRGGGGQPNDPSVNQASQAPSEGSQDPADNPPKQQGNKAAAADDTALDDIPF